jgi:predicted glycoside hydrolase/deacetylase ChbG (UPF0249 family)
VPKTKILIVNADDFGQSPGVNRGIIEAHEHGIVTSASLMVRWPVATEAAAYAKQHPELSVGLHLDLGEWAYRDGEWRKLYEVVKEDDSVAVAKEVEQQVTAFHHLMRRNPTHIDSHQHRHRHEPARSIVLALATEMAIPVRDFSADVRYTGEFYGQADKGLPYPEGISVKNLLRILEELPSGSTELGCHPAVGRDLDTMYQIEREQELETLCDARARKAIARMAIELTSYHRLGGRVPPVV